MDRNLKALETSSSGDPVNTGRLTQPHNPWLPLLDENTGGSTGSSDQEMIEPEQLDHDSVCEAAPAPLGGETDGGSLNGSGSVTNLLSMDASADGHPLSTDLSPEEDRQ